MIIEKFKTKVKLLKINASNPIFKLHRCRFLEKKIYLTVFHEHFF